MFGLGPATKVYLAVGATDMRKGFDGLYGLVRDRLLCEQTGTRQRGVGGPAAERIAHCRV
jgi:IS66 Orf2 like protein